MGGLKMICTYELNVMKEAYEKLYVIENLLRNYITQEMEKAYGVHWFYIASQKVLKRMPKKEFDSLHFYELESYLRVYNDVFADVPFRVYIKQKVGKAYGKH